jgi:hypothetical protein
MNPPNISQTIIQYIKPTQHSHTPERGVSNPKEKGFNHWTKPADRGWGGGHPSYLRDSQHSCLHCRMYPLLFVWSRSHPLQRACSDRGANLRKRFQHLCCLTFSNPSLPLQNEPQAPLHQTRSQTMTPILTYQKQVSVTPETAPTMHNSYIPKLTVLDARVQHTGMYSINNS